MYHVLCLDVWEFGPLGLYWSPGCQWALVHTYYLQWWEKPLCFAKPLTRFHFYCLPPFTKWSHHQTTIPKRKTVRTLQRTIQCTKQCLHNTLQYRQSVARVNSQHKEVSGGDIPSTLGWERWKNSFHTITSNSQRYSNTLLILQTNLFTWMFWKLTVNRIPDTKALLCNIKHNNPSKRSRTII